MGKKVIKMILSIFLFFIFGITVFADDEINANRWVTRNYYKINAYSIPCGEPVYIFTCNSTECSFVGNDGNWYNIPRKYLDDNQSDAKKYCSDSSSGKTTTTTKKTTTKKTTTKKTTTKNTNVNVNANRWVIRDYKKSSAYSYSCGNKIYIYTCNDDECSFVGDNGNWYNIPRKYLSDSESDAKKECGIVENTTVNADRWINKDYSSLSCGSKVFINTCNNDECSYELDGKWYNIPRKYLSDSESDAKKECGIVENTTVNADRWLNNSYKSLTCGSKVHINTCNNDECSYELNGKWYNIPRKYLSDSESDAKKECGNANDDRNESLFKILYDQNYGHGLECEAPTAYIADGVCEGYVHPGNVKFPSMSLSMYNSDGLLVGWTKTVTDGKPNCNSGVVIKNKDIKIEADTDFYACYREDIGGYRYLMNGFLADGGTSEYQCGSQIWIEYCTRDSENNYCYYYENSTSTYRKIYRDKISDNYESAQATCDGTANEVNDYRWVSSNGDNYSCGDKLYVTSCTDETCLYSKIISDDEEIISEGSVNRNDLSDSESDALNACEDLSDATCNNKKEDDNKGEGSYTVCFDEDATNDDIKKLIKKYYKCDSDKGYYLDETSISSDGKKECDGGTCTRTYSLTCTKGNDAKPVVAVTSGLVQSDGYGDISVTADAQEGKITSYYYSEEFLAPTDSSKWINVNSGNFKIENLSPGVVYIWVRDSKGNISNAVGGAVLDTKHSDTTAKEIKLYDKNGNVQTPSRTTAYNNTTVKSSKYVMLSNNLDKDSKVIADGFNPYDMEYKLKVDSPTVSVYATLTSTDSSYVDGYEPRTVNLNYGVNTVLIKIKNKEGVIRTYTILVTRVDGRTSDNTLSDISLSVGSINFNANVTDYKVEIPKSTTSVNVKSTIASDVSSYVEGYEPGEVSITSDTTVKLLKVKSQTGSTRTYVITFVKEGTDIIEKKSLQLSDLVIPGVYMPFEKEVANYSLSVDYETDVIDLNPTLEDDTSSVVYSIKKKNDKEYKTVSNKGIGLDLGENFIEIRVIDSENEDSYYRLTIIRKEFGLGISDDNTLKDLKVLGYDDEINFEPSKKEYTVRIKQEKSLVITAVPNNNRAEVFIRGNDELTGFSTVRVKVVAENGKYETYSIDIKKDAYNKTIEIAAIVAGVVIILVGRAIIIVKKKSKAKKEYFEE